MQSIYYGTAETAALFYRAPRGPMTTRLKLLNTSGEIARTVEVVGAGKFNAETWVPTRSQAWNPSPLKTAELIRRIWRRLA